MSQSQEVPGLSRCLGELTAVVGLRGGLRVTDGLSVRGPANAAVGDLSDDFTFIIGSHRYQCPSSVAQFLSPRVSRLRWIDATISELRLEVEDGDEQDNRQPNGIRFAGTFAVALRRECQFIRLVNISRNHIGDDQLAISAWEIFGNFIEAPTRDSSSYSPSSDTD
jgi:hypothetical protein